MMSQYYAVSYESWRQCERSFRINFIGKTCEHNNRIIIIVVYSLYSILSHTIYQPCNIRTKLNRIKYIISTSSFPKTIINLTELQNLYSKQHPLLSEPYN